MLRRFTQDFGRYRKGDLRDYPKGVWTTLAGKRKLESITEPVDMPPEALLSATRSGGGLAHPKAS